MKKIELLAPAKNLTCGIEAINNGADAVYIGASKFGARAAAGNSLQDIEQLCNYAHQYYGKVFVTLNTILTDKELEEAQLLVNQLYDMGADALIIQDMGLLMLDLPPIPLHASTQTDNRSIDKINFLKDVGFERVVLARELSLQQIAEISSQTEIELEAFVYGAVCVSYSGRCYMSQYCAGRSANRGNCAQFCRLPYTLTDKYQHPLISNKHLLSLQDMNRTKDLQQMIEAGITSFKIEGRLKEVNYVKNVTAWFRQHLDQVLENKDYSRASSGQEIFTFKPQLTKTFHRGSSSYFLNGRERENYWFDTPKSIGEKVGKVDAIHPDFLTINGDYNFANGDGLCFFNKAGELEGFRINKVENGKLYPEKMPVLFKETVIYRNDDHYFNNLLKKAKTRREIAIGIIAEETSEGFYLTFSDEDENSVSFAVDAEKQEAVKGEEAMGNLKKTFSKLGNTIFYLGSFEHYFSKPWFIPASSVAKWKTQGVDLLMKERLRNFEKSKTEHLRIPSKTKTNFFDAQTLDYMANVLNSSAKNFYRNHGAKEIEPAMEQQMPKDITLMNCKYCIKHVLNACPKEDNPQQINEPLYLKHKQHTFKLKFDCGKCEMKIVVGDR
ncbi:U32 family peptidase [Bacteroidales bacterium OttesenSCG-928-B11]|nr:U32 family peptidase [Bacteroidales bacterium OttesenSCG-928-E04]MDL2311770.1 U32 family peptidase [Bacteroidales bacterium OttesenSCG-928-B11]MDL2325476.1 U32 family peptidase [Bacteroidales bacterium OttesenSCG-928-A14]